MRSTAAVLLAVLMGAECERAPVEDFATRRQPYAPAPAFTGLPNGAAAEGGLAPGPRGVTGATAPSGRCILATPRDPAPPVAPGPAPGCPPDPEGGPGRLPLVRVVFPDAPGVAVDAELVRSEHDTMRGLMYRKFLASDRGMLFDLAVRDDHKFWMHNTCIPLDLLFVDEDGLLVGIVENAPTLDDGTRGVGCPSRWVLEVNAGWCRRHDVKAGQRVTLP